MPKLFFTFCAILLSCVIHAQGYPRFTSYGVDQGLAQSSIYDIDQDKDGFIWIGTAGGLSHFDGYQMKTYKQSAQDPKAISSYKEFRFYNDSSGKMWIISFNGISVYNSLTDNFDNILVYSPKNVVIAENHFFGEDKDFIWIGLCNYGIVKVDKRTQKVHPTTLTKTSFRPSNNVAYHGFLEKGKLWIVDNNESVNHIFSVYDIKKNKTDTLPIQIIDVINLNDSEALGLTLTSVVLINKKTLAYRTVPVNENGREHNVINMYRLSVTEVVLSSTIQGLFYIDTRTGKVNRHIAYTDPENKKTLLYARCVFTDRSGNTWIGTRGEGVYKMSYPFKKFRSYRSEATGNNNVFGISADTENLYIGLVSQGLAKFSKAKGFIASIPINKNLPYALNNINTLCALGKDKLMIMAASLMNNGSCVALTYTKATGKIELMNKEVQKLFDDNWGRGNLRHFIFKDTSGNYLTPIGENLVSLRPCGNNNFCPSIVNRFPHETLTCGFTDRDGRIWVGSFTGVFRQTKNGWERVNLPKNKEVKSIGQDPDGNIWMGSNDDIFVVNKELKTIQTHTEDNGLVNGHVYAILKDNNGNMWFSHNKGLSVYRWKEKTFEHFDKDDGLQSSEFNVGAAFKAEDGELFFGGINGVTAFYPDEILHNPNAPPVKITGIKLFDEPYKTDIAYWNIRKLELPYTENSISFEFALPEYTNSAKNRYTYIMQGVDDKWIDGGDRRFTRYAGLRPGNYTFKVKGFNNDGVLGNEITSIDIIIIPPFWQRTWFIVLCSLAFILLSVGIGILIQKQRQKKTIQALEVQHKIQLERERISRDLHDNVGTQLSLISKNIQGVIDPLHDISDAERIRNLSSISQTSKEVIFTLRETIWALNKEEISLEELSDKLKTFAQKLFALNRTCRLLFTENIEDANVVLSPSETIHLFRICQEAITNSLKYANAGAMDITITSKKGKYSIVISDDGIGFEPGITKATAHYGLANMKFRAGEIACDFMIDTMPGQGTKVTIRKK